GRRPAPGTSWRGTPRPSPRNHSANSALPGAAHHGEPESRRRDSPLYLEDLRVGQRFVSGTHRLDEGQIRAFAGQFDPQPLHLDAEAAKATLFGGLVASGWHTAAITMRLLVLGGLPIAGGLIGAGADITWPNPTRPGDVLQVESEVLELWPSRPHSTRKRSP